MVIVDVYMGRRMCRNDRRILLIKDTVAMGPVPPRAGIIVFASARERVAGNEPVTLRLPIVPSHRVNSTYETMFVVAVVVVVV